MRAFLAALLALGCAAAARGEPAAAVQRVKRGDMDWKSAGVAGQYRCRIPADWQARPAAGAQGMRYGDGVLAISVARRAGTQAAYLRALPGGKPQEAGTVTVSGVKARLLKRQYRLNLGGEQARGPAEELVFEEFALLPAQPGGFWVLRWRSPAPVYQETPDGGTVWRRFLRSFRLE